MNRRIIHLILTALFFTATSAPLLGQENFREWKEKREQQFQGFKNKRDKEFAEFLRKRWKKMALMQGLNVDVVPKPVDFPPVDPNAGFNRDMIASSKPVSYRPSERHELRNPEEAVNDFLSIFESRGVDLPLDFFGYQFTLHYAQEISRATLASAIDRHAITDFWSSIAKSDLDYLIEQVNKVRSEINLNDWGYVLLLEQMGSEIFDGAMNHVKLFVWFMLTRTGFDSRVGYHENRIELLLRTSHTIYQAPILNIGDKRYFLIRLGAERHRSLKNIHTYGETDQNIRRKPLAMGIAELPKFGSSHHKTELRFTYNDENFTIPVNLNLHMIRFFNSYPQTDLSVYFSTALSNDAHNSLVKQLEPLIAQKSEIEAANILLRFVQTAFAYQKDDQQFGIERPLFAEETLYYPYSDCEDRSILYAYLVRNLLGLEVRGLDYPGHVATGIRFSSEFSGDYVQIENQRFFICDPTFINADIGICMPQYQSSVPQIIGIE